MKLTPLDIYQKEFRRKTLNGLDPEDVEEFLFQVAEGVEALLNENEQLRRRLEREAGPSSGDADEEASGTGSGREEAMRELERARQEARRVKTEAEQAAHATIEEARAEAERILKIARTRARSGPAGESRTHGRAVALAREYQSVLVRHLAEVTTLLGELRPSEGASSDASVRPSETADEPSNDDATTQLDGS